MKEPYKELDELLKGFVEGTLTESEQRRFEEILKSDCIARQRYLDYIAVESMLGTHKLKLEHSDPAASKVKLKISPEKNAEVKRKVSVKTRRSGSFLILAATVFLALGLGWYVKFYKENNPPEVVVKESGIGVIEKLTGEASIVKNGRTLDAVPGMPLISGTGILCNNTSGVNIRCSDGSLVKLAPGSHMIFSKLNGRMKFDFIKGSLNAEVSKQPVGKPLLISTPNAHLKVIGTVLRVSLATESTLLTVDEGSVEIKNSQNQKVTVHADESAMVQRGNPLAVRSLKEYKVNKLEIISAFYGEENKWVDLTLHLRSIAGNSRLIPSGAFFNLAGDPIKDVVKSLKVEYKIDGIRGSVLINEYKNGIRAAGLTTEIILPEL